MCEYLCFIFWDTVASLLFVNVLFSVWAIHVACEWFCIRCGTPYVKGNILSVFHPDMNEWRRMSLLMGHSSPRCWQKCTFSVGRKTSSVPTFFALLSCVCCRAALSLCCKTFYLILLLSHRVALSASLSSYSLHRCLHGVQVFCCSEVNWFVAQLVIVG